MTRLVVHAGTHATGWLAMQRQLVAWREPLDAAGVRLHPADRPESWLGGALAMARGSTPAAIDAAADDAVSDQATMLLLSSERLGDALRDADQVASIAAFAASHEMPLTIVSVVRDQLGCLNELYVERVVQLQMARSFSSFVLDANPAGRFDYATAFNAVIEHPDIDLIGVPYADLRAGAEAKAVLAAAGVDVEAVAGLAPLPPARTLPGPYHVAAARLMFKRLWRLGTIAKVPRAQLAKAAEALQLHAVTDQWDDDAYWGWDPEDRANAIDRYRTGNDALARTLWGRDWGDDWELHDFVETDLASSDPQLLVDVLTTVDTLVKDLQPADDASAPEDADGQEVAVDQE